MKSGGRRDYADGVRRGDRAESGDLLLHLTTLRPLGWFGEFLLGQLAFASEGLRPGLSVATRMTRLFLSLSHLDCLPPLLARS